MENLNKDIKRTKYELHLNIIGRFILATAVYFLGMCVTFIIFFLMVGLEAFVRKNLNWNIFFGTPIASKTRWMVENSIWILAKFMLIAANIFLFLIAARMLNRFKSTNKESKSLQPAYNEMIYSIIYAIAGFVFGLGAAVSIGICYFFIGAFAGLKFMGHPMYWSDGFVILVMPVILAVATVILFVITGMKGGKRCCC